MDIYSEWLKKNKYVGVVEISGGVGDVYRDPKIVLVDFDELPDYCPICKQKMSAGCKCNNCDIDWSEEAI